MLGEGGLVRGAAAELLARNRDGPHFLLRLAHERHERAGVHACGQEGANGYVGDQVMLLCYMYDPTRGRYGLAVMTALRAAGVATVGVMTTAIFVMIRRERRTSPAPPAR